MAPSLEERAAALAAAPVPGAPPPPAAATSRSRARTAAATPPTTGPLKSPKATGAAPARRGASRPAPPLEVPRGAGARPAGRVVLGIDPGTRVVGWGALVVTARGPRMLGAGVIRAGDGELCGRLGLIRKELDLLIQRFQPEALAVEEAFAHKNVQSALRIGEGRGVVLSCAGAAAIPVHQYPPATAKKALVGHGAAHKTQVAAMVARRLGLAEAPGPLDASDALALALTHVIRARL